jgi:AraC-like DNA-binding protein
LVFWVNALFGRIVMHYAKPQRFGSMPSSTGGIARLACKRVREAGENLARLVSRAGLTMAEIDDPHLRLDVRTQIKLLELAAEELQDDYLGFHLAQDFDLREIGLLYYVMASSASLAETLLNAERYSTLNNEGIRVRVNLERRTLVALRYIGVERDADRHQVEFWLAALLRICRHLADSRLVPGRIRVRHRRLVALPPDVRSFLGCGVEFETNADEILFSASVASLPSVKADPYLNRLLLGYADEAMGRQKPSRSSISAHVEEAIAQLLPHGRANVQAIASRIGMSRRTLARALAAEGTTFAELLDRLRFALAKRYLLEWELPISNIAWLLGYRETSSFTNAFRRWAGSTPREFRVERGAAPGKSRRSRSSRG